MTDFHVALVALDDHPGDLDALGRLLVRVSELENEVWRGVFGHEDFAQPLAENLTTLRQQSQMRKRLLVALSGAPVSVTGEAGLPQLAPGDALDGIEVLGSATLFFPLHDNTHLVDDVEIAVRPDRRRQGIGRALAEAVEQLGRFHGATTVVGWGTHEPPREGEAALRPAEGDYSIARDAGAAFALAMGFSLAQCDRHSTAPIPTGDAPEPAVHPDYELLVWEGVTPEEHLEQGARLREAFARDLPKGELDVEEQKWTVERVREAEAAAVVTQQRLTVCARHLASGDLVALTHVARRPVAPEAAWQGVTQVVSDHRGRGLGKAIKQQMVLEIQRHWPETRRLHTWNAGENRWMLAINDALGYQPATVGAAWQKKLA